MGFLQDCDIAVLLIWQIHRVELLLGLDLLIKFLHGSLLISFRIQFDFIVSRLVLEIKANLLLVPLNPRFRQLEILPELDHLGVF